MWFMCNTILTFSPWKNNQSIMWVFFNFVEVCSCFYSNFFIKFWIRISFVQVYQTILLLHLRKKLMLMRDFKCKQWRIRRRGVEENQDDEEHYEQNIVEFLFFVNLRLCSYMSKNHIQVSPPPLCFETLRKH